MNQKYLDSRARFLAERLFVLESDAIRSAEQSTPVVFGVKEKLRRSLSTVAGSGGFRSLLSRALVLAKAQAASLEPVNVELDGSLMGWSEVGTNHENEAGILLIAHFLGLLFAFIGIDMSIQLVRTTWPELPLSPADFSTDNVHGHTT